MRSLLFLPASRPERFAKALASNADIVILDLEDGVAPEQRADAREHLAAIAERDFDGAAERVFVRISSLNEVDGIRDITSVLELAHLPRGLLLCKVETASEVRQVESLTRSIGRLELLPVIESAAGIACADKITANSPTLAGIGFGSADYTRQTTGTLSRDALLGARGRIVNAAAVAQTAAIDGAWLDISDPGGLEAEARHALDLGFSGKIAIHPEQVDIINRVFSPTEEQIAWASRLLDAVIETDRGAFTFEGQMVDSPVIEKARQLLRRAR